jgi:predicted DNA-binding transcriptional regulator YafY
MRAVTVRTGVCLIPLLQKVISLCANPAARPMQPDGRGSVTVTLTFESLEDARNRLLSLGRAVEVLEPDKLRRSIVDFATQTLSVYQVKP